MAHGDGERFGIVPDCKCQECETRRFIWSDFDTIGRQEVYTKVEEEHFIHDTRNEKLTCNCGWDFEGPGRYTRYARHYTINCLRVLSKSAKLKIPQLDSQMMDRLFEADFEKMNDQERRENTNCYYDEEIDKGRDDKEELCWHKDEEHKDEKYPCDFGTCWEDCKYGGQYTKK